MSRLGILGGGQLGALLAQAASKLKIDTICWNPDQVCTAAAFTQVVGGELTGETFPSSVTQITYEWENIPAMFFGTSAGAKVAPPPAALHVASDRLLEKNLFTELGIPTNRYSAVKSIDDLNSMLAEGPVVLKKRSGGYDGKGQWHLRDKADLDLVTPGMLADGLLAEALVPFSFEVSVIGVRSLSGQIEVYPLFRNRHEAGILVETVVGDPQLEAFGEQAASALTKLLEHFRYVGVLALELFVTEDGFLANEMAPRVHNSGHITTACCQTSQFESHVRAVMGLPLEPVHLVRPGIMINLIGTLPTGLGQLASDRRVQVYDYQKSPRPGRKLGHINISADTLDEARELALKLRESLRL